MRVQPINTAVVAVNFMALNGLVAVLLNANCWAIRQDIKVLVVRQQWSLQYTIQLVVISDWGVGKTNSSGVDRFQVPPAWLGTMARSMYSESHECERKKYPVSLSDIAFLSLPKSSLCLGRAVSVLL